MTEQEEEDKLLLVSMVYSMGGLRMQRLIMGGERWYMGDEDVTNYVIRAIHGAHACMVADIIATLDKCMVVDIDEEVLAQANSPPHRSWWRRLADWWHRLGLLTHGED